MSDPLAKFRVPASPTPGVPKPEGGTAEVPVAAAPPPEPEKPEKPAKPANFNELLTRRKDDLITLAGDLGIEIEPGDVKRVIAKRICAHLSVYYPGALPPSRELAESAAVGEIDDGSKQSSDCPADVVVVVRRPALVVLSGAGAVRFAAGKVLRRDLYEFRVWENIMAQLRKQGAI